MVEATILAGYFSAHAIWCVCDGETLIPIYAHINSNNERSMVRLAHDFLEEGVAAGQEKLESNPHKAVSAVLIYDGRIDLETGKIDALIVEFKSYIDNGGLATLALPYTPVSQGVEFAVHRPKLLTIPDHLQDDLQLILTEFFNGVAQHEKGSEVWNQCLDESI